MFWRNVWRGILAAFFGVACYAGSVALAGAADSERIDVRVGEPAHLVVWNRLVVVLQAEIQGLAPAQRVQRAGKKIENVLADLPGEKADALPGTLANLTGYWVRIDGVQVFGLLPEDADTTTGQTLDELVTQTVQRLQGALDARQEQRRLPDMLQGAALALVATLLFAGSLWLIGRLHRRTIQRSLPLSKVQLKFAGLEVRPLLQSLERGAIKLTTFGLWVIASYLWLTFVFARFPYTRPWGERLAGFLEELLQKLASGALDALPGLFTVLVIFVLTRFLVKALGGFFHAVEQGSMSVSWLEPDTAKASRRVLVGLIWVFALTVAYPYIPGSESPAFKGIGVLAGLMVSLGSAGLVNQLMSGLVVVYSRALAIGDYVKVGETEGTVSEVGMLSTKVVTPKRECVTVPNAVLVGSPITNYSRLQKPDGAMVGTTVTIGYDAPWRQVHAMLEMAADRSQGVRKEPRPVVLQKSLADFYPEYHLVVHIDRAELRRQVLSELHGHIQDVFNEFGVQIMSPHFETQPESKVWAPREQWYAPPAKPAAGGAE